MAILVWCSECKLYYSRKRKTDSNKNMHCPKCDSSLVNSKKFRINVITPEGKRITKVVDGNLTIAKRIESKIKGDIAQMKHLGISESRNVSDVWNRYLTWAKVNKKSWKADKSRWDTHVAPIISNKKMDAVSRVDIDKIIEKMGISGGRSGNGCSKATIKQVIMLISRVYNWAIEAELYNGNNPTTNIKPPKVNNQITECLTPEELNRLYLVLDKWWNKMAALIVRFALYTGLRADEIMGLGWKDVDIETGFLSLDDPKGKPVKLPLNDAAIGILNEAKEISKFPECEYIFHNKFGNRRRTFTHIWYRIRDKAKLPEGFRFHGLRHTYASYLASSGEVDLYTLQKLLNHQDPKMTQRYAHLLDGALRKGANVAGKVFGNGQVSPSP